MRDLSDEDWQSLESILARKGDQIRRLKFDLISTDNKVVRRKVSELKFPQVVVTAVLIFTTGESDSNKLFASWKFPNVEKLEIHNVIPPLEHFQDLTEFKFYASGIDCYDSGFGGELLEELVTFLQKRHRLRILRLDFEYFAESLSTEFAAFEPREVTTLFISNHCKGLMSASTLGRIFAAIMVPNATDVRLQVDLKSENDNCIAPVSSPVALEAAEKVSYLSIGSKHTQEQQFIECFCRLSRNVRKLEIEIPKV